jgi:hypothetical protein
MDPKQFLLEHFEKMSLGIACAIFGAFIVTSIAQESPADQQRLKVAKANTAIAHKKELAESRAPRPEQPTAAREVEVALKSPSLPKEFPEWLFHKRPVIATKIEGVDIPEAHHYPPAIEASEGGLGMIGFRWSDDARNTLVKVDKYVVKRAEGAEATNWKEIATVEAGRTSYTDKDVKPKTNYFYQVVSYASVDTTHPNVVRVKQKGFDVTLPSNEVALASPVIGPLQTKRDIFVEVVSVVTKLTPEEIKMGAQPRTPAAYLKVWKYFPERKEWLNAQYTQVKIGETVGKLETVGVDKRDFKTDFKLVETKRVRVPGRFGEIEADCAVIEDTTAGERTEINNQTPDPELEKVKKNPRPGADGGDEDEKDKKKPGGK